MAGPSLVCRLDHLMKEKGVTGRQLAAMAQTSEVVITKLRRNRFQMVDKDVTARVCLALDVTPGELLEIEREDADT